MSNLFSYMLCSLSLIVFSEISNAELYKWVDDDGNTHYSDKVPEKNTNSEAIPVTINTPSSQRPASGKVILKPYEKAAKKLHILDTTYLWKKESYKAKTVKLGVYNTGRGCTSRGAINTPDVFIHHEDLLPNETAMAYRIRKTINGLDYDSERTGKRELIPRLKKTNGLSLRSEMVQMDFSTCAPRVSQKNQLTRISKLPINKFSKHRLKLQILWTLKSNRDQDLIYQTTTEGHYNGWQKSGSSRKAVENAIESSVLKLFSDQSFVDKILLNDSSITTEIPAQETETPVPPVNTEIDYVMRALTGQAFYELSPLKIYLIQFYQMQNEWPGSLQDMQLSERMYAGSKTISHVSFEPDGSIAAELTEVFGANKTMTIYPVQDSLDTGWVRWNCSTNLPFSALPALPAVCESQ